VLRPCCFGYCANRYEHRDSAKPNELVGTRCNCLFQLPNLLVAGTDIKRGPLHHDAVRGACVAVIDQGIALLRSGYQRDSALWIHRLAVRCQQIESAAERPGCAQRPRP